MSLLSVEDIKHLHKKYAPSEAAFQNIWQHGCIVAEIAVSIAQSQPDVDIELVRAGGLLHDIGVYKLYNNDQIDGKNYITHGLRGYELLKAEGIDEILCRFAAHHTGVGITKTDIQARKLPLPAKDFLAESVEEEIVMYSDKFHSKTTFNSAQWYKNYVGTKFGQDKADKFQSMLDKYGEPNIHVLAKKYNQPIR